MAKDNEDLKKMARELYSKMSAKKKASPPEKKSPVPKKAVEAKGPPDAWREQGMQQADDLEVRPTKKASPKPAKKAASKSASSKKSLDAMDPGVSPKAPKAKAAKAAKVEGPMDGMFDAPIDEGMPHDIHGYADEIKGKLRAKGEYPPEFPGAGSIEHDLPKGGGKMVMHEAEELIPGAAEKSAMKWMRLKALAKPSLGKTAAIGALGGAAGLGLQALMESLDAEEAGDPNDPIENRPSLTKKQSAEAVRLADKAETRQAAQAMKSGRLRPPQKHMDLYGVEGPDDQQKLEDEYAKEMARWPR